MSIYVAYNGCGDLIASADSYAEVEAQILDAGYSLDEVFIGMVTP